MHTPASTAATAMCCRSSRSSVRIAVCAHRAHKLLSYSNLEPHPPTHAHSRSCAGLRQSDVASSTVVQRTATGDSQVTATVSADFASRSVLQTDLLPSCPQPQTLRFPKKREDCQQAFHILATKGGHCITVNGPRLYSTAARIEQTRSVCCSSPAITHPHSLSSTGFSPPPLLLPGNAPACEPPSRHTKRRSRWCRSAARSWARPCPSPRSRQCPSASWCRTRPTPSAPASAPSFKSSPPCSRRIICTQKFEIEEQDKTPEQKYTLLLLRLSKGGPEGQGGPVAHRLPATFAGGLDALKHMQLNHTTLFQEAPGLHVVVGHA